MYANYKIQGSKILLTYTSSKGEFMGQESWSIKNKFINTQDLAYSYASFFARSYRTTLQALRAA